jgi:eukaryotic-like serine/threonine-protein kinase
MMLGAGTKLGRYEIRSKLGAGGMGEVYLAEDTQLRRRVALKILSSEIASQKDRMRRFVLEAQAAAALNHPSIAHIYEIGSFPKVRAQNQAAAPASETHFIAMEFIDGVTLRDKIHRDQASLAKLLKYLTQVAEGLAKAHSAGIVHRDLKPDNIMITRDDFAKILDFGLAKLVEPQRSFDSSDTGSSEIATAVMPQQSIPGMVMGTVGYMSPEQAAGRVKEIDPRSDIFSFGCILFEAVTGSRAFEGKDVLDSLHKIVHAPTPLIREFNATVPDDLQRIVRRCLAKEPDKRYQSIKDVAIELEELQQEMKGGEYSVQSSTLVETGLTGNAQAGVDSTSNVIAGTAATEPARSASSAEYLVSEIKRHKGGAFLVLAGIGVLVAGVAFGLYKWIGQRQRGGRSETLKITRLTSTGKARQAAISPDGKYVAYSQDEAGQQSLWLAQVAVSSNAQIVPPAEGFYRGITFSRDGNFIYYVRIDKDNRSGALYQMPVLGGNARKLLVDIETAVTLSPDGRQLAFLRTDPSRNEDALIVADADGTGERKLITRKHPNSLLDVAPAWSPDGKVIAFAQDDAVVSVLNRTVVGVWVADGKEQPITSQRWEGNELHGITWLSDGSGVLVTASEQAGSLSQVWLLAWPGDEARRVTNGLDGYIDISLAADSGTLAAVRLERVVNLWVAADGDAGRARQITSGTERQDGQRGIAWTPDGKILYYSEAGGNQNIWIMSADGTGNKQLSANAHRNRDPAVSPDGRYVVWESNRTGNNNIWRMDIDGGAPKQLTESVSSNYFPQISGDGMWVVYEGGSSQGSFTLWRVSINGGVPEQLTDQPSGQPVISPDGKTIAYAYLNKTSGQGKIALTPFESGSPTKVLDLDLDSITDSRYPLRWTPDGRSIAFIRTTNGVSNIWAQPLAGGEPKQLTVFKDQRILNFAWSHDGKQLAFSRGGANSDVALITGFKQP